MWWYLPVDLAAWFPSNLWVLKGLKVVLSPAIERANCFKIGRRTERFDALMNFGTRTKEEMNRDSAYTVRTQASLAGIEYRSCGERFPVSWKASWPIRSSEEMLSAISENDTVGASLSFYYYPLPPGHAIIQSFRCHESVGIDTSTHCSQASLIFLIEWWSPAVFFPPSINGAEKQSVTGFLRGSKENA
jgi:hypothetical protein